MGYGILSSIPEICVENIHNHTKINVGISFEELSNFINNHGKEYAEKILIEKCKEIIDDIHNTLIKEVNKYD